MNRKSYSRKAATEQATAAHVPPRIATATTATRYTAEAFGAFNGAPWSNATRPVATASDAAAATTTTATWRRPAVSEPVQLGTRPW